MPRIDDPKYFRKGLGNKAQVAPLLHADYHSGLTEWFKASGFSYTSGDVEIRLAKEFGFCYGVDRAVEYAYECRDRFPDRRILITGEIIHNPWVNRRLEEMGIGFLSTENEDRLKEVEPNDVVLIPAFGMEHEDFLRLRDRGVILVDTTCGSVLSVWKSVERYAREGFTAIVHGKKDHEETLATCSQVRKYEGAHYLVLRDMEEAGWVCEFLEGRIDGDTLMKRLPQAASPGFDPSEHLQKLGLANQTTMLSTESLEIAALLKESMRAVYGPETLDNQFRSFDTICSATQDRQDAVKQMLAEKCDLMVVVGGFNSSNTTHLLEICLPVTRAYHVEDVHGLVSPDWIRHKPLEEATPILSDGWLPQGPAVLGVTAGASTPDTAVGATLAKLMRYRNISQKEIDALSETGSRLAEENRKGRGEADSLPISKV